jgi:uncharacterized protein (TIGR03086 family)
MSSAAPAVASLMADAAAPFATVVPAAARARLDAPTPCAGWDLRALVDHLLHWAPVLTAAGARAGATAPAEVDADLVTDGWPATLVDAVAGAARAWSVPVAWEGTVSMGGPEPLPAGMVGGMVLGELVVHGWDLARTVGLDVDWPQPVAAAALEAVTGMAGQGRAMGVFGAEVPVPADASALHRALGLAGRDPAWTPPSGPLRPGPRA